MDELSLAVWAAICGVAVLAGFVKGAVGFAMPTIMISLLGSVLPPDRALAALILPTLCANGWQALRGGLPGALASARLHWRFIAMVMIFIALSAQMVSLLPTRVLYLVLGGPIILFALVQLAGWTLRIAPQWRGRAELGIGAFAGAIGGVSGVWGPPTVMYLTALETPKVEHIRVQGVVYGLGAVMLLGAHVRSGILNAETLPLSLFMLVPAGIGLMLGFLAQDRLDQVRFKRMTLIVLVLAGANLLRRGLLG
ncbi:sulfite exporter TauE/SafE family protein [Oceaniglobus trochenteri]|uniref:sulfite exporter TauE/SafE family protein n=1 Tax=Oceaniglobus trochenteri TaxID=2763260 RepID=UPI001D0018F5|nr:sulfite exporter TauE/SafE family protein [Oceaniglobus trochenteri]